ncbi:MAG: Nramp family divalent metal transporter, partial [Planctomycetales bacterium]|nr:Nramp family divalent metal transporter [Planctomycetales bacterium]
SPRMSQAKPSSKPAENAPATTVETPPTSILGILSRLGPGLIIAGSIVGSGELIGTTKTGAQAGFWLLWLIVVGCVIKVFVQVELGRDAIVRGKTTLDALSEVPGPSVPGHGNWLIWYFFLMFFASIGQLGGIVGGVGQAMALSFPITAQGRETNQRMNVETELTVAEAELKIAKDKLASGNSKAEPEVERLAKVAGELRSEKTRLEAAQPKGADGRPLELSYWSDDKLWAVIIAILTSVLLVVGRYRMIESVTTTMVASFTLMTVLTVIMLQTTVSFSISWQDLVNGFSFRLPPPNPAAGQAASNSLATALKTFGVIGVGASELISYPYWCIEKGYARFTGKKDETEGWGQRARGWMNVMRWDAWCSMGIYTIATVAFYLLGAAVLKRANLDPKDDSLMRTLNVMYEPVFGAWSQWLFLIGAFAVLYSTYFVANAGHSRVFSDALRVAGVASKKEEDHRRRITFLSGFLPLLCLVVFLLMPKAPDQLVLFSGMMQAIMLPMLSVAALFFRYRRNDKRVSPGIVWDICLWVSTVGMFLAAGCLVYSEVNKAINKKPTPAVVKPA